MVSDDAIKRTLTGWQYANSCAIDFVFQVLSTVLLCFVDSKRSWLIAAGIGVLYQWFLSHGLSNYLEDGVDGMGGRRSGIVDANREGIYSCFGYLAIYFAGVQIGRYLFLKRWEMYYYSMKFVSVLLFQRGYVRIIRYFPVNFSFLVATYDTSYFHLTPVNLCFC